MKLSSIRNRIIAALFMFFVWWVLSLAYPPLIIPDISQVAEKIVQIVSDKDTVKEAGRTLIRLLAGLFFGMAAGGIAGYVCGVCKTCRELFKPVLGVLQVVPPVALLVLAIIWFGFNGKPAVVIAAVSVFPITAITVQEAILHIDRKLIEMGKVFKYTKKQQLFLITWPSIKPRFYSGLRIALGTASKTVVMGEVLTTSTGIGGQIVTARLNIEPETIIAWTVISVCMYYLLDAAVNLLFPSRRT
ncbi:ABC transporter permease [Treponema parvum]|uniref:ABC transporter permease n=1 Tax=Treponema parvum TaxID=138851 RepID=A0A975ICX3_9SPIR|nr:ABC transporter permease [Treponema parvum]QTQ11549.1 ABC transporter permease [Treponema parvum]QTQ16504.1 ABC transporter permease [Treponema parvum]